MKKLLFLLLISSAGMAQVVNAPKIPNVTIQRLRSDVVSFSVRFQQDGVNLNIASQTFKCDFLEGGAVAARGVAFQGNEYVVGYGTEGVAGSNIIGPVYSRVDYSPYSYRWGKHSGAALLADGSNFTTQMMLTNGGNLGVGTAVIPEKLTVEGNIRSSNGAISSYKDGSNSLSSQIYFANPTNSRAYNWQLNADGSAATFWGFLDGVGWGSLMSIGANGNVGIGTAAIGSSTSTLDVDGVDGYNQIRARKSATPSATAASDGQTGNIVWDDNYIYIKTSAGWKRAALSTF